MKIDLKKKDRTKLKINILRTVVDYVNICIQ